MKGIGSISNLYMCSSVTSYFIYFNQKIRKITLSPIKSFDHDQISGALVLFRLLPFLNLKQSSPRQTSRLTLLVSVLHRAAPLLRFRCAVAEFRRFRSSLRSFRYPVLHSLRFTNSRYNFVCYHGQISSAFHFLFCFRFVYSYAPINFLFIYLFIVLRNA